MIIYKATNKVNGKIYIGQTTKTLKERIYGHTTDSKRKNRTFTYFQNAIRKHGIESFEFIEIDNATSIEELNAKEEYWISFYNSTNPNIGYNLDSGGKNCKKADSTKDKLSVSSKRTWMNNDAAQRMMEGLRRGTITWQRECAARRVTFECPYCHKKIPLQKNIAKNKLYCSAECERKSGHRSIINKCASEKAAEIAHQRNVTEKAIIAEDILSWTRDNKEYILECKNNNITKHYKPLLDYLNAKYNRKDLRSYYLCFGVNNGKEFAKYLINYVSEENICCAGLN